MKLKRVIIHASHLFNNPWETHSNYRVACDLEGEIEVGDWPDQQQRQIQELQAQADAHVAQHKQQILDALEVKEKSLREKTRKDRGIFLGKLSEEDLEPPF